MADPEGQRDLRGSAEVFPEDLECDIFQPEGNISDRGEIRVVSVLANKQLFLLQPGFLPSIHRGADPELLRVFRARVYNIVHEHAKVTVFCRCREMVRLEKHNQI